MGGKIEGISFYRESQDKGNKKGKNRFLLYSLCHVFLDLNFECKHGINSVFNNILNKTLYSLFIVFLQFLVE